VDCCGRVWTPVESKPSSFRALWTAVDAHGHRLPFAILTTSTFLDQLGVRSPCTCCLSVLVGAAGVIARESLIGAPCSIAGEGAVVDHARYGA